MTTSRREIPDATTWVDADATALMEAKDAIRALRPDAGIGVLALMARIVVAGLHRFPELNARVDTEREEIVQLARVNLGFAAQSAARPRRTGGPRRRLDDDVRAGRRAARAHRPRPPGRAALRRR